MDDILGEAQSIIQCKECPWYKSCILPMRFTADDLRRQMQQTPGMDTSQMTDVNMQNMLANMATAAQNTLLEGCPVLIERLRSNPALAQRVKELMHNWGKENENPD